MSISLHKNTRNEKTNRPLSQDWKVVDIDVDKNFVNYTTTVHSNHLDHSKYLNHLNHSNNVANNSNLDVSTLDPLSKSNVEDIHSHSTNSNLGFSVKESSHNNFNSSMSNFNPSKNNISIHESKDPNLSQESSNNYENRLSGSFIQHNNGQNIQPSKFENTRLSLDSIQHLEKQVDRSRSNSIQSNFSSHSTQSKKIKMNTLSNLFSPSTDERIPRNYGVRAHKFFEELRIFFNKSFERISKMIRIDEFDKIWPYITLIPDFFMFILCFGILQWNGFESTDDIIGDCQGTLTFGILIYIQGCISILTFIGLLVVPAVLYTRSPALDSLITRVIIQFFGGVIILIRIPILVMTQIWISKASCRSQSHFWWILITCICMWISVVWNLLMVIFALILRIFHFGLVFYSHRKIQAHKE